MGNSCCIKPPIKRHYSNQDQQIYIGVEIPYPESEAQILTKRTSQPSLFPLNKQIDNLITKFQKENGKISHSFTKSNAMNKSISPNQKIQCYGREISQIPNKQKVLKETQNNRDYSSYQIRIIEQIQHLFLQRLKQDIVQQNNLENKENNQQENNIIEKRKKQSEIIKQKMNPQSQKYLNEDNILSSFYEQQENDNTKISMDESNFLWDSLVNEQVNNVKKEQMIKNYNNIENIDFKELGNETNMEKFGLSLHQIMEYKLNNTISSTALIAIVRYYQFFEINLCAMRKVETHYQIKIHINGHKRFMPVFGQLSHTQLLHKAITDLYKNSLVLTNPSTQVYHLSGWIPEILYLSQIQNKDNLWNRLIQNFTQGNITISFSSIQQQDCYLTPYSIDIQQNKLKLINITNRIYDTFQLIQLTWQQLLQLIEQIYINWNPYIYQFSKKVNFKWNTSNQTFKTQSICLQNNPQYLLKIPKHTQDCQIRLFSERLLKQFSESNRLSLKLFQYNGSRILNPQDCIKTLEVDSRELLSDVFIFEVSDTTDYFVLVVLNDDGNQQQIEEQIAFSLLFLSFIDIEVKQLPHRQILMTNSIISLSNNSNIGYNLNSPLFLNNLQYSIRSSPQSFLQIFVQSTTKAEFSLILIQDKNSHKDITLINFQSVLNQSIITEEFQSYGFIEKQTQSEDYVLVIALNKSFPQTQFKITVNTLSKLFKRNKELEACSLPIIINEISIKPIFIKEIEIKWEENNTGPRKRLKQTSGQQVYHPIMVFEEFLKNPYVVIHLKKGNYQFNLLCQSYMNCFFKSDHIQGEPPALSIALFKNSDNNKGYKIIEDDAFYVPIGYGFWTRQISLQQGRYTIVCARVIQINSTGILRIRQI